MEYFSVGLYLDENLCIKECERIRKKIINNLKLTYSERIFMQIMLDFLKSQL